ncbi:hypothetical protein BGX31_005780 [Mortierella sp. GBA43]|nr:hypothetical protein BGX31_005780 [Mortierella sp. GBA43]
MAGCFDAYDECHRSCVPEDQEEVAPPTTPATPNPVQAPAPNQDGNPTEPNKSNNQKHKDVTHETDNPIPAPAPGTEVHQDSGPTQEDIENLPEYEEDEDYIPAPPGGEDDEEFEDDVSDY